MFHSTATPVRAPAVIFPAIGPGTQAPVGGAQWEPLGFGVVSFAAPSHHRGPLKAELAGSALASPRPGPDENQVGADLRVALPNREYVESPPKRVDFAVLIAVAGKFTTPLLVTSKASLTTGTAKCTGAPAPCAVT